MKKLLVLAAVSAMVMGAKAEYTLELPGAKAVYVLDGSNVEGDNRAEVEQGWPAWRDNVWLNGELIDRELLDGSTHSWEERLAALESKGVVPFTKREDGKFSLPIDSPYYAFLMLALTDADQLTPGARYVIYWGTTNGEGGPITLDPDPIDSGFLPGGSPTPVPEPTSGLLLLLGVAGLALKRRRG